MKVNRFRGVALASALFLMMAVMVIASLGDTTAEQGSQQSQTTMLVATPVQLHPKPSIGSIAATQPATKAPEIPSFERTATPQVGTPDFVGTTAPTSQSTVTALPTAASKITPTPAPTSIPAPLVEAPLRLRIPALEIDSAVQWVGLDDEGRMGVPDNYTDVAWYELGPRPGMPGNAVIAGHLDSTTGPAIFFKLEELRAGDELFVIAHDGAELRFVVEETAVYNADDAPLARIFGPDDRPRLNLITCDGVFDRSSRAYDKRLVVFAVAADA